MKIGLMTVLINRSRDLSLLMYLKQFQVIIKFTAYNTWAIDEPGGNLSQSKNKIAQQNTRNIGIVKFY